MLFVGRSFTPTGLKVAFSVDPVCDFLNMTILLRFSHSSLFQPVAIESRSPWIFKTALVEYKAYGLNWLDPGDPELCSVLVRTSCGALDVGAGSEDRLGRVIVV